MQSQRSCAASIFRQELDLSPSLAQLANAVLVELHSQSCVMSDSTVPRGLATRPNVQEVSNVLLVLLDQKSASPAVPGITVAGDKEALE